MRFAVVTPCWNAEQLIGDTALAVLSQRGIEDGGHTIHYVVIDGGSTDQTLDRLDRAIRVAGHSGSVTVEVVSEPDAGMYDALAKGLSIAHAQEPDVVSYINAGDYYVPFALDTVASALAASSVDWLTGLQSSYNPAGHLVRVGLPTLYRKSLLDTGFYGGRGRLGFIQQESTFWSGRLSRTLPLDVLRTYRLAGDSYMWSHFATLGDLCLVDAVLGGHRRHPGQLSEDISGYRDEMARHTAPPRWNHYVRAAADTALLYAPKTVRRTLMGNRRISWDERRMSWVRGQTHHETPAGAPSEVLTHS